MTGVSISCAKFTYNGTEYQLQYLGYTNGTFEDPNNMLSIETGEKVKGIYQSYLTYGFIIGDSYNNVHSSSSFNLYKITWNFNEFFRRSTDTLQAPNIILDSYIIKCPSGSPLNTYIPYPTSDRSSSNYISSMFYDLRPIVSIYFNDRLRKDILQIFIRSRDVTLEYDTSLSFTIPTVTEYYSG